MSKNIRECRVINYKGKTLYLTENDFGVIPGFRLKINGIEVISINRDLPKWKKQLELHRFITGRGIRNTRNGRSIKYA